LTALALSAASLSVTPARRSTHEDGVRRGPLHVSARPRELEPLTDRV
jgi:hypothetical protein